MSTALSFVPLTTISGGFLAFGGGIRWFHEASLVTRRGMVAGSYLFITVCESHRAARDQMVRCYVALAVAPFGRGGTRPVAYGMRKNAGGSERSVPRYVSGGFVQSSFVSLAR